MGDDAHAAEVMRDVADAGDVVDEGSEVDVAGFRVSAERVELDWLLVDCAEDVVPVLVDAVCEEASLERGGEVGGAGAGGTALVVEALET